MKPTSEYKTTYLHYHELTAGTNRKYKANEFKDALMTYADAWYQLLPYHIEALPLANPLRQKLGQM